MKNEVNGAFMAKKKEYIYPVMEVTEFRSDLMKITGPASVPTQAGAPKKKVEVF